MFSNAELEARLREREPAVRLVSELTILRLMEEAIENGSRIPDNSWLPIWVARERFPNWDADPSIKRFLLISTPDDRLLHRYDDAEIESVYIRLLDRVRFVELAQANDFGALARFEALPGHVRREITFVLDSDRLLPDEPTVTEVAITFAAVLAELALNRPESLGDYFPLFVESDLSIADYLEGIRSPVERSRPSENDELTSMSWPDVSDRVSQTRNHVRTAIEFHRRNEDRVTAIGILCEGLGQRLKVTLNLDSETDNRWKSALAVLLPYTSEAKWTSAARALYELQKMALDLAKPLVAIAPFEWLRSFGQFPVRRPLDHANDIIRLRHLMKIERHLNRVPLKAIERQIWNELLHHEQEQARTRISSDLTPILRQALEQSGLVPASRVESIAREKLIQELVRIICARGFFRLADLRDAIARNSIKLPDLAGPREILTGDELLRADKILSARLFGVYQRGEIYLRGIQRISSIGFGTIMGRLITLFILLPFGGAFLTLEFLQHLLHGAVALLGVMGLLSGEHHPHVVHWWTVGLTGGFFLGLIHSKTLRHQTLQTAKQVGRAFGTVFLTLPRTIWNSHWVRIVRQNRVVRFLWYTVALPLAMGLIATLLTILYSDWFSPAAAGGVGLAVFFVSLIVLQSGPGRWAYDSMTEFAMDTGRFVWASLIPGLISWFVWIFREVADAVERFLYTADEWFRFREGQSRELFWFKVIIAIIWFPIAYVVRFVFYLLVEPQVNPVKHFPVVTVSHKIIWPMVPQLASWTGLSTWTMGTIVNGIPGIFGFMAWELMENWRLYASNRSERMKPVPIGHHGETMRGLLRLGFHSGTVPKLYRKLRAISDAPAPDAKKSHHLHHEIEHIEDAIRFQIESEFVPLLPRSSVEIKRVIIGCQRIDIELLLQEEPLTVSWELIDREIKGFEQLQSKKPTADERAAIVGIHALMAVRDPEPPLWSDWAKRWEPQQSEN